MTAASWKAATVLIDTDNLVSSEEFRRDLDKYMSAAQEGRGPVAVLFNVDEDLSRLSDRRRAACGVARDHRVRAIASL